MIGRLRGVLLAKQAPDLLLEVNGVGYEVAAPLSTFYNLPDLQSEITLLIHLVVREDAHILYGFATERERALFRALIKINGVGPKLALTILSGIEPDNFVQCILNHNVGALTQVPGVGKKTAERLLVEMADRVTDWHKLPGNENKVAVDDVHYHMKQEAMDALIALGYKSQMASRALAKITGTCETSHEMIRLALQGMAS